GKLKPCGTIVEATSGNTGAGLAMVAAVKGYKCIFVMPDKMSQEKIDRLRGYGARVIVTPTNVEPEDPRSYYSVAQKIVDENKNAFLANQYHNPSNPEAHYRCTGPEIWEQTDQKIDAFVAGIGTGGTISGVGKFLKEQNKAIKIIGVDTVGSILQNLFYGKEPGKAQPYKVEGIGEDFMPSNLDFNVIDHVVQVNDKESLLMARRLAREEGIFAGGSSGSAVCGALKYAKNLRKKETILVLLPDSGLTYLSKVFSDEWMTANSFLGEQDTVKNLIKGIPLIEATSKSPVSDIFEKMRDNGVSQIPIIEDSQLVGIVNEKDIYEYLLKFPQNDDQIKDTGMIHTDTLKVKAFTPISELHDALSKNNAAIVVDENDHAVDIITKIDVINYLFEQNR
ncbi:MAG: pyridoxal-phosphate dependent enzyme, partial [bacterium]